MVWAVVSGNQQVEVQLTIFSYPGIFSALFHLLISISKLFKNMITFVVSSITMDINDEKHSLVGFLSKVLVVQRQA